MISTSIVILNWNGRGFLEKFLPTLIYSVENTSAEIIVADNGSTDGSVLFLQKNFPGVKLIVLDRNFGYAGGYNRALEQLDSKYFILLNSDIEVPAGWMKPLISVLEKDKKVAAVMPKILDYNRRNYFEYAGAAGGFIDKWGYPFCRGRVLDKLEQDKGQYDNECTVFWASGACFAIRASAFNKAGGFDEKMFAHMEEIDLCWRLHNLKYKIKFTPESKVYHIGGGTLPNESPGKLFLNFRNNLILLYKNLPSHLLYKVLFLRFILDGLAAIRFLLSLRFRYFYAVLKAHFSFYHLFKGYRTYRKENQPPDHLPSEIYPKSVLVQFFIKKKRILSDLENQEFSHT